MIPFVDLITSVPFALVPFALERQCEPSQLQIDTTPTIRTFHPQHPAAAAIPHGS